MSVELAKAYVTIVPAYEKGIQKNITSHITGIGDKAGKEGGKRTGISFGGALNKALIAGSALVGIGAGIVSTITKEAVDAFADAEQLRGGVEKLFGGAADTVMQNASSAFQSAGMSANDFMQSVTSFSAALINSVGGDTAKAAQMSDMAIRDMSDNANVFGSSLGDIERAYQSFARGQFGMLDNLKLGYGGTKTEMERLLQDAQAISGIDYDVSSYADIVEAIHVIQTEMGITGTTAKEASETISGSINMAKAAYQNWLAGLADENADLDALTQSLIDSVITAAGNVSKILPGILEGITRSLPQVISGLAPMVTEIITSLTPALIQTLPALIDAGLQLFTGLIQALSEVLPVIIDYLPVMIEQIGTALVENLPILIPAAINLFLGLVVALVAATPEILRACFDMGVNIIAGIVQGITEHIGEVWRSLLDGITGAVDKVLKFLGVKSPSRLFKWIFEMVMEGGVVGIESGEGKLQRTLASAVNGAVGAGIYATSPYSLDSSTHAQNVYINGARLNDSEGIQSALIAFMLELQRLGVMQGASA